MDNDDAIVGRILTRREALRVAFGASASLTLAGFAVRSAYAASNKAAIPTTQPRLPLIAAPLLTEGPFFVDEKLNRSNILGDSNRASVINGLPLLIAFTVYKMAGKSVAPMSNVMIDLWHADASGAYSDESNPMNHEDTLKQTWLRGYQITNDAGAVQFETIFPGWYEGRTPHIHFKVRQLSDTKATTKASETSTKEFTSQLFFHEKDSDGIIQEAFTPQRVGNAIRITRTTTFTASNSPTARLPGRRCCSNFSRIPAEKG